MQLKTSELVQLTELRREMPTLIEELEDGRREKVVVTKHGEMKCVIVSVPSYEAVVGAR
jgi:prevent-host-death family protein